MEVGSFGVQVGCRVLRFRVSGFRVLFSSCLEFTGLGFRDLGLGFGV